VAAAIAIALLVLDAVLVQTGASRSFDLGLERWVQSVDWGPLQLLMRGTNWVASWRQTLLAAVVIGVCWLAWRSLRLALQLAVSLAAASASGEILKIVFHRPRPSPGLVHLFDAAPGWSFPSGHAIFYTWLGSALALLIGPRLGPPGRALAGVVAVAVVAIGCLGRVWAGVHWPTDVIGGFLIALAWVTLTVRAPGLLGPLLRR
jgi:membrane-associated phospholipid phosphatase